MDAAEGAVGHAEEDRAARGFAALVDDVLDGERGGRDAVRAEIGGELLGVEGLLWRELAASPLTDTGRAGMPTATAPGGMSSSTTAPAPITASSPIVIPPRTLAPAPMVTRSPTRGQSVSEK